VLLNKESVLDKGFIAPLEFSGGGRLLQEIQNEYFTARNNFKLLKLASASLVIKCPLFVQLNLQQYGLDVITTPSDNIEAYIPDVSMIEGNSLAERQQIAKYIQTTTDALLLNQVGLSMDGGSDFTSQLLMPITVYNEIIVHGKLENWIKYLKQPSLPKEVELYRTAIYKLLETEWKNIGVLLTIVGGKT
jgi:hypothetical protein